jgi:hypothetical protein
MALRFSYIDQVLIESGFFPGKILGVLYMKFFYRGVVSFYIEDIWRIMKFFYSENADSNVISSSSLGRI